MQAEYFLDTNVLLYSISENPKDASKKAIARKILARNDWGVSVQVLQEFYVNATKPKPQNGVAAMTIPDALDTLQRFMAYPVVPNSTTILLNAVAIAQRFNISFWDASIVAAASSLGSKTLYTEDLNNGQKYDSILAVNPFETGLST